MVYRFDDTSLQEFNDHLWFRYYKILQLIDDGHFSSRLSIINLVDVLKLYSRQFNLESGELSPVSTAKG